MKQLSGARQWAALALIAILALLTGSQAVLVAQNLGAAAAQQVIEGFTAYQKGVDSFNLGYFLGADAGWPLRRSRAMRSAGSRAMRWVLPRSSNR